MVLLIMRNLQCSFFFFFFLFRLWYHDVGVLQIFSKPISNDLCLLCHLVWIAEVSTEQFRQSWTQCLTWRSNIYGEEYLKWLKEKVEYHPTWLQGGNVEGYFIWSRGRVAEYPILLGEGYVDEHSMQTNWQAQL